MIFPLFSGWTGVLSETVLPTFQKQHDQTWGLHNSEGVHSVESRRGAVGCPAL